MRKTWTIIERKLVKRLIIQEHSYRFCAMYLNTKLYNGKQVRTEKSVAKFAVRQKITRKLQQKERDNEQEKRNQSGRKTKDKS